MTGSLGTPLQLQLTDPQGNTASADTGDIQLQAASKRALTAADVEAAVGQLGDNSLAPAGIDLSGLALDQGEAAFDYFDYNVQVPTHGS